ncbi:ABC transporter substrate-binding protein [Kocuria sp. TGY1127_2]|uniref:ABC transporter substrate-binding protein n=1 Tax=Kocuria sp. TGY1127_2 TaxID=2711328 RepID=UPI0015B97B03|nr:ABC transporter substrate-binding protein [Kocuria sp. TGY1127_2]
MPPFHRRPLKNARLARAVAVGISAVFVLAGCGSSETTGGGQAKNPVSGGTLKLAFDADPGCVDGQQAGQNVALNVTRQVTDSLTYQDPESGELEPWLAESWDVNPDSTEFTFHLRDGVKFQDGTDFTSTSVEHNLRAIQDLGAKASLGSTYLTGLSDVQAPDERTVTVKFDKPNAQFLQATSTMTLGFYSDSTLGKSPDQRCGGEVVGTGPFQLKSYTPRQSIRLDRFDDYGWAPKQANHRGPAYLDAIDMSIVPESTVRNGSLASGQIDVDTVVQPQDEELLQASNFTIVDRPNPGVVYNFIMNESRPLFSDERVRQAVTKSINRDQLRALLSRYQEPATSVLAGSTPDYQDFSGLLKHDPDGAAKLLDEAGWTMNSKTGLRQKDGKTLSFTVKYWQSAPFLELVQQQLRETGIEMKLEQTTVANTEAASQSGEADVEFMNLTRSDPDVLRTVFDANGANRNKRDPAQLDQALDQSVGVQDPKQRKKLVDQAVTSLIRDAHSVPLVELSGVIATGPRVKDFKYDASSRIDLYDTWLNDAGGNAGSGSQGGDR